MKIQGAIRKLKCEQEKNNTPSVDIAYVMAIEALEKQIPKKVIVRGLGQRYCLVCGFGGANDLYCRKCGQKLDN